MKKLYIITCISVILHSGIYAGIVIPDWVHNTHNNVMNTVQGAPYTTSAAGMMTVAYISSLTKQERPARQVGSAVAAAGSGAAAGYYCDAYCNNARAPYLSTLAGWISGIGVHALWNWLGKTPRCQSEFAQNSNDETFKLLPEKVNGKQRYYIPAFRDLTFTQFEETPELFQNYMLYREKFLSKEKVANSGWFKTPLSANSLRTLYAMYIYTQYPTFKHYVDNRCQKTQYSDYLAKCYPNRSIGTLRSELLARDKQEESRNPPEGYITNCDEIQQDYTNWFNTLTESDFITYSRGDNWNRYDQMDDNEESKMDVSDKIEVEKSVSQMIQDKYENPYVTENQLHFLIDNKKIIGQTPSETTSQSHYSADTDRYAMQQSLNWQRSHNDAQTGANDRSHQTQRSKKKKVRKTKKHNDS